MRCTTFPASPDASADETTRTALYKFHQTEKRRELRRRHWRLAGVIAGWIWAGCVIAYLCHVAIRLSSGG